MSRDPRDAGEHHFSHWFLYSSAYASWGRLRGWFDEGAPPSDEHEPDDEPSTASDRKARKERRSPARAKRRSASRG